MPSETMETQLWGIAIRGDQSTSALKSCVAELATCSPFKVPGNGLRIGTLDSLMSLSDDLAKMDVLAEATVTKMYKQLLSSEGGGAPAVLHYQLSSKNKSMAVIRPDERKKLGTYHMNLILPWPTLQQALLHVLSVAGRVENYQYRTFEY